MSSNVDNFGFFIRECNDARVIPNPAAMSSQLNPNSRPICLIRTTMSIILLLLDVFSANVITFYIIPIPYTRNYCLIPHPFSRNLTPTVSLLPNLFVSLCLPTSLLALILQAVLLLSPRTHVHVRESMQLSYTSHPHGSGNQKKKKIKPHSREKTKKTKKKNSRKKFSRDHPTPCSRWGRGALPAPGSHEKSHGPKTHKQYGRIAAMYHENGHGRAPTAKSFIFSKKVSPKKFHSFKKSFTAQQMPRPIAVVLTFKQ